MKKMRLWPSKAFTTVEAVISLALTVALICLAVINIGNYRSRLVFENTIRQTELNLEHVARVAAIKNETINVTYFANSGYLHCRGESYQQNIRLDPSVKISNLKNMYISKEGTLSPRSLTFTTGQWRRTIRLQMMWGRING
jgi:competence protein ComGD